MCWRCCRKITNAFEPLRALMEKISARMLEIRVDGAWLQVLDCPGREGNYLDPPVRA